jgi:hypothetical protein
VGGDGGEKVNGLVLFFGGLAAILTVGATRAKNDYDLFGATLAAVLSLLVASLVYR